VPVEEGTLIPQVLDEIEKNYMNPIFATPCDDIQECDFIGGIGINWHVYGTSGHKTRCPGLLFENYRYRADNECNANNLIKTICNPRVVSDIVNPHYVIYIPDYCTVSENGSVIPHAFFFDSAYKKLCINHYKCKSEEEYLEKNKRGWPDIDLQLSEKELYEANVDCSKVYDPIMNRYIDELKQRVASYGESNR
jgi:hypothetical protein